MKIPAIGETEAAIQLNRARIVRPNMQKRNLVAAANLANQFDHHRCRVSMSQMVRMRAYRADLGEPGHAHTLAGHRRKLPLPSDAEKLSQLVRARHERPRLRHRRQRQHLGRIRRVQLHKIKLARWQFAIFMDHLQQRSYFHDCEARGLDVVSIRSGRQNDSRPAAGANQSCERRVSFPRRLLKRRERTNLRLEFSRRPGNFTKMRLRSCQCRPNRIVERMRSHDANLLPHAPRTPSVSRAQTFYIAANLDAALRAPPGFNTIELPRSTLADSISPDATLTEPRRARDTPRISRPRAVLRRFGGACLAIQYNFLGKSRWRNCNLRDTINDNLEDLMKRSALALFAFLLFASVSFAQQSDADAPASKADIERYLDAMHSREMMKSMMVTMSVQLHKVVHQQMEKQSNLPPNFEAKMDKKTDDIFNNFPVDDLIDVMIPVYQKHLTKGDVDAMVAFYSTPTGQKLLKELPAITAESMQAASGIIQKMTVNAMQQVQEEIAQAQKENETKPGDGKTPKQTT